MKWVLVVDFVYTQVSTTISELGFSHDRGRRKH